MKRALYRLTSAGALWSSVGGILAVVLLAGLPGMHGLRAPPAAGRRRLRPPARWTSTSWSTPPRPPALAAVRELTLAAPGLRVALSPAATLSRARWRRGLSVEDARNIDDIKGGFYQEWRSAVIAAYRGQGISPFTGSGRFVYQPEAAQKALWEFARGSKSGNATFYSAKLLAAATSVVTATWTSRRKRAEPFAWRPAISSTRAWKVTSPGCSVPTIGWVVRRPSTTTWRASGRNIRARPTVLPRRRNGSPLSSHSRSTRAAVLLGSPRSRI